MSATASMSRPQSLDGPLVGVSAKGKALLLAFLVLSGAKKDDCGAFLEDDGTQEMLEVGASSSSATDAILCRGKDERPP